MRDQHKRGHYHGLETPPRTRGSCKPHGSPVGERASDNQATVSLAGVVVYAAQSGLENFFAGWHHFINPAPQP